MHRLHHFTNNGLPAIAIFATVLHQMMAAVFVRLGESIQS